MINLHLKYPKQLAEAFSKPSFLTGKVSERYDWLGVKTIRVSSITTQAMGDYTRSGTSRFGTPTELQDTYQEMSITQDKSFSITIDNGNNQEQDLMKNAGTVMAAQLREQTVPTADKYAFAQFVKHAGKIAGVTKPDKTTIIGAVLTGLTYLNDALVPDDGRTVWATSEMCQFIAQSTEYMSLRDLGRAAISRGELGEIQGASLVRVPASYLPTNCYFLITYKESILHPKKINKSRVQQDPVGVDGSVLEGRFNYDAFVLGQKCNGVYACVLTSAVQATPTITDATGHAFTIASSGADTIMYTTDGSDPRYSPTALTYSSQVTLEGAATVKAVAYDATNFTSAVAEQAIA